MSVSHSEFEPTSKDSASHVDAIGVMVAHHIKLRAHLVRLSTIDADMQRRDGESLDDAAELAAAALDVFGREGQLHSFDEDALLFPQLRETLGPADVAVRDALDRVDAEHTEMVTLWPRLECWLTRLLLPDEMVSLTDFHDARLALEARFLPHLQFEERVIYPAARRLLGEVRLHEMMISMLAHRARPSQGKMLALP